MIRRAIVLQKRLHRYLENLREIQKFIVWNDAFPGFDAADGLLVQIEAGELGVSCQLLL